MTTSSRGRSSGAGGVGRAHVVVLLLTLAVLSACGPTATNGDDDNHQFASRTQPPRPSMATPRAGTPAGTPAEGPDIETTTVADPASLFTSTAKTTAGFFLLEGQVVIAHPDGRLDAVSLPGAALAVSIAPNGTTAAVLVGGTAPGSTPGATATPGGPATPDPASTQYAIVIVDASGKVVRTVDDVMATVEEQPAAAEALTGGASIATIALGPNIDDLLVAFSDGLLVRLPTERAVTVLPGSGNFADVRQVVWAPNGRSLAIVAAEGPDDLPAVYYSPLRADGIDPVRIAPASGRTTDRIAWLPDAAGVVFTDATGPLDAESLRAGRDLFVTPLRSDRRTLAAAAGVIGPSAGVVDFAVAPGGGSVAYTLYRTDGDQVAFNSLWVGALGSIGSVQINLPDVTAILGLAWTVDGLLVLDQGPDGAGPDVLLVGDDGVARPPGETGTPAD